MLYDDAVTLLNGLINDATDPEERDALIDRRDALTDPGQPLANFTCKSAFGNVADFVTAEQIPARRFVRVAVLTNMGGDTVEDDITRMGDCDFDRVNTKGEIVPTTAHWPGHTVQNHVDQFKPDRDFHLFTAFPLFRGAPLKQGNEIYYDNFEWGVYFNRTIVDEEDYPETIPANKVQDINDPLLPEPVSVKLHCDFTWEACP
jgi:hypothetical protein